MADQLTASISGCSNIISVTVSDSHSAPTATATIQCLTSSLDVGDSISIDLGTSSSHQRVFSGYVKNIQRSQSPTVYEISCANAMVRAIDYFIVSDNPTNPYARQNIPAQTLIQQLMAMAGLTNYTSGTPGFTFATNGVPLEVNLTSVYDYCKFIADIIAWHIYADDNGQVHFVDRPPFPQGGDPSVATCSDSNLTDVSYWRSDRDLRNRVVVYGSEGVQATAKASSPYLPGGFYKSIAVAAPTVITSQSMAQSSANYNLAKLNRLTIGGTATILGDPSINCRSCVTVNKSDIGMSGKFYVYGIEHSWGREGYKTQLDLRQ
jgi:hypothetical protein